MFINFLKRFLHVQSVYHSYRKILPLVMITTICLLGGVGTPLVTKVLSNMSDTGHVGGANSPERISSPVVNTFTQDKTLYTSSTSVVGVTASNTINLNISNIISVPQWNLYQMSPEGTKTQNLTPRGTRKVTTGQQNAVVQTLENTQLRAAEIYTFIPHGIDQSLAVENILNTTVTLAVTYQLKVGHQNYVFLRGFHNRLYNTLLTGTNITSIPIDNRQLELDTNSIVLSWQGEQNIFQNGIVHSSPATDTIALAFGPLILRPNETYTIDPVLQANTPSVISTHTQNQISAPGQSAHISPLVCYQAPILVHPQLCGGGGGGGGGSSGTAPALSSISFAYILPNGTIEPLDNTISQGLPLTISVDVSSLGSGGVTLTILLASTTSIVNPLGLVYNTIDTQSISSTGTTTYVWTAQPGVYAGFEAFACNSYGCSSSVYANRLFGVYNNFEYPITNITNTLYDSSGNIVGAITGDMGTGIGNNAVGPGPLNVEAPGGGYSIALGDLFIPHSTSYAVTEENQTLTWNGNDIGYTPSMFNNNYFSQSISDVNYQDYLTNTTAKDNVVNYFAEVAFAIASFWDVYSNIIAAVDPFQWLQTANPQGTSPPINNLNLVSEYYTLNGGPGGFCGGGSGGSGGSCVNYYNLLGIPYGLLSSNFKPSYYFEISGNFNFDRDVNSSTNLCAYNQQVNSVINFMTYSFQYYITPANSGINGESIQVTAPDYPPIYSGSMSIPVYFAQYSGGYNC